MPNTTSRFLPNSVTPTVSGLASDYFSYLNPAVSGNTRAASIQNAVQAPATSGTQSTGASLQSAIQNIVRTGSATPAASTTSPTTPATTTTRMATLVNPTTGARQAVAVGSQDAQRLFGQGFVLETATPTAASTTAPTTTTTTATTAAETTPSRISLLRSRAQQTRADMFNAVYGYNPEEWENLPPESQRRLRNLRVQGLAAELGNYSDAIRTAQEEEAAARTQAQQDRENALATINAYTNANVLDQIPEAELASLASASGLSTTALQAMGRSAEHAELMEFDNNLYSVTYDEDGNPVMTLQQAGTRSGSGGGSSSNTFERWYEANAGENPQQFYETVLGGEGITGGELGPAVPESMVRDQAYQYWLSNIAEGVSIPSDDYSVDIQSDIEAGAPLSGLFDSYPEVSRDTITSLYYKAN